MKIDPQNLQILKDLSLLQVQIRDLIGFAITRHAILELKPDQKTNWLSFALSKHLTGHIDEAINIIDIYLDTLKQDSNIVGNNGTGTNGTTGGGSSSSADNNPEFQCNYESSELALYKNMLIYEKLQQSSSINLNYKKPYEHLLSIQHLIKDKYSFLQTKARYELQLSQFEDAKNTYNQLFDTFGATEDYSVHSGYMCSILRLDSEIITSFYSLLKQPKSKKLLSGARTLATIIPLSQDQKDILHEEYTNTLLKKYPKSLTVRRIPLTLLNHDSEEWQSQIQAFIKRQLQRGVPSLGSDLASLFLIESKANTSDSDGQIYYIIATDPSDVEENPIYKYLSDLVDGYISSLEQHSRFPGCNSNGNIVGDRNGDGNSDLEPESPSTLLWTWYLRAVLYDIAGQYSKGIEFTKKCLEQTPTAVDIYELQGKLYEHAGDIQNAVFFTDKGRLLDKQDRYINNQTVKYLLQAGDEEKALETIALFTRHESDPEQNIYDMQCYWYEMALGDCFRRKGEFGKALKKFSEYYKNLLFFVCNPNIFEY